MRVPNISTYVNSTYRLGNLTSDLESANEVVSSQKQLNEMSDDPLGLSQVLTLKSTLSNLTQIDRNVNMGKSWIKSVENALDDVKDLIIEIKIDIARLANDSTTADERQDAIERVQSVIEQIVSLGNTQVNGNYIFAGSDTNVKPFEYDAENDQVIYHGDDNPFEITTGQDLTVAVGRAGSSTFWDSQVDINSTNNTIVFSEDNGKGDAFKKILHAQVPEGLYTATELQTAIRNALNDASQENGYGVSYAVEYDDASQEFSIREDGSYQGYMETQFMWETGYDAHVHSIAVSSDIDPESVSLSVLSQEALTVATDSEEPLRLTWNKADKIWTVEGNPGYVMPQEFSGTETQVLVQLNDEDENDILIQFDGPVPDGASVEFSITPSQDDSGTGHEIGFHGTDQTYVPPVSDIQPVYVTSLTINTSGNNTINFTELNSTGGIQNLTANFNTTTAAIQYTDMSSLAKAIETAMETASAAPTSGANTIDYTVTYDAETSRFNIREDGATLNQLTIDWSTSTAAADTLGYYTLDDTIEYPHSEIVIGSYNNRLDFAESIVPGTAGPYTTLQAVIPSGIYSDMADLAAAVESAMESASGVHNYTVTYDAALEQFSIQGSGAAGLTQVNLLWNSGLMASSSIGETLGYDPESDDIGPGLGPYASDAAPARFSLFSVDVDEGNNVIDFEEINTAGGSTTLSVQIPAQTYTSIHTLETTIEEAMNSLSSESGNGVVYDVSYDEATGQFGISTTTAGTTLTEMKLLWDTGSNHDSSIGETLGFDLSADSTGGTAYNGTAPTWISFDSSNNVIDFREVRNDGTISQEISITIPPGDYNNLNQVAAEIESAMRSASPNHIEYVVIYDDTQGFMIKGGGEEIKGFDLLWETGDNTEYAAAEKLGMNGDKDVHISFAESDESVVNIIIDQNNNKIDFKEIMADNSGKAPSALLAEIEPKTYTSHTELAQEVEEALEKESRKNGNEIDYTVVWDENTQRFTIKENGSKLDTLHLMWQSGENAPLSQAGSGQTIGTILGFDGTQDDLTSPLKSQESVSWGIFDTLFDLKDYLQNNDREGIDRSIGRLEANFDDMTSRVVDAGMKYNRLEARINISSNISLSLKERRSVIEDADIVESIMNLQMIETAYQAALSSTAKVLSMSLVDYLK